MTVLCGDLANLGFQTIDIGHIDIECEWFLMWATEVVPIKSKCVNEAKGKMEEFDFINEKYNSEIIKKIL